MFVPISTKTITV